MCSETALKREGMVILARSLGLVQAERFIALMNKEPFDYTTWQQSLFVEMTLDELLQKADAYQKENF